MILCRQYKWCKFAQVEVNMEEKEFYEVEELEQDLNEIKEDVEMLKEYDELIKKVRELKEDKR